MGQDCYCKQFMIKVRQQKSKMSLLSSILIKNKELLIRGDFLGSCLSSGRG